jgi:DNA-nicking Smr family endonuclease
MFVKDIAPMDDGPVLSAAEPDSLNTFDTKNFLAPVLPSRTPPPIHDTRRPSAPQKNADPHTLRKLSRGKIPVEATLDLHGLSQADALEELRHFLIMAHGAGKKTVLVITGKGTRHARREAAHWHDPDPGVLRRRLPDWLAMPPLREIVLDHCAAKHKHGGEGAQYVLLRRKR